MNKKSYTVSQLNDEYIRFLQTLPKEGVHSIALAIDFLLFLLDQETTKTKKG